MVESCPELIQRPTENTACPRCFSQGFHWSAIIRGHVTWITESHHLCQWFSAVGDFVAHDQGTCLAAQLEGKEDCWYRVARDQGYCKASSANRTASNNKELPGSKCECRKLEKSWFMKKKEFIAISLKQYKNCFHYMHVINTAIQNAFLRRTGMLGRKRQFKKLT